MFGKIIDFSIHNKTAVLFFTLCVVIAGAVAFKELTIEAFPDPTSTQVEIIALYHGQSTEEIERQVSIPIERALNGTPGLERLRSVSMFGLSFVTLTFEDSVSPYFARAQVTERLQSVTLPEGVEAELGPLATPIGEVYRYTLKSSDQNPLRLRTIQDWVIAPKLMQIQGVAEVVSYGGLEKQIQIQPHPGKLASHHLSLSDIEEAIKESSSNASGGIMERGSEQLVIRSEGIFKSLEDIAWVPLPGEGENPLYLRDVAKIVEGWAPRQGVVSHGQDYDAVQGIILMRRGENPSQVLRAINQQIQELNQSLQHEDVEIQAFYDRTDLVNTTLKTVGRNLGEGALLVMLVLFIFLLDLKAALIVASVIPLSLLFAFLYLHMRGMSANLLSMGAIDFGIIVDGSVVIVEAIVGRLALKAHADALKESIEDSISMSMKAVIRPTVFALLIIIAAYLPIFLLEKVEGRMFSPMANTVVAALLGALIFSLTLVPVLSAIAYKKGVKHRESWVLRLADKSYRPALEWVLKHPFMTLLSGAILLLSALTMTPRLGSEFLPELNEGALWATFTLPPNASLNEGRSLVPKLIDTINDSPLVDDILTQLGRPEDGTDPKLTNDLEVFIKLKAPKDWPSDVRSIGDAVRHMDERVSGIPGVEINFSQPIRDNVQENISGQVGEIALKFYGDNLAEMQSTAEEIRDIIAEIPGVADLALISTGHIPNILIEPDRRKLASYKLGLSELQHVIQASFGGSTVGSLWDGEMKFDLAIRYPESARNDIEKLRKLQLSLGEGASIPLESVAKVHFDSGFAAINRENGKRYIGIRMNVRGRDLGSFVEEAKEKVESQIQLSLGQELSWGGEFESKERAMKRLQLVVPIAVLLTLILLFQAFKKFAPAVLTLLNVPFALIGGLGGLAVASMPISVAAMIGFISLIGLASLNGVLLLSSVLEREARGEPSLSALLNGCRERLRPVLLTAALAALGLIPAATSRGIGSETQKPIAVVIVGGTLSACFLTLLMLPAMYRIWSMMKKKLEERRAEGLHS